MKKLILAVFLFVSSSSAMAVNNWSYIACKGYDTTGQSIYLTAYEDSSLVTINGSTLRIVGYTQNKKGVVTETFIATNGMVVYDSIVPYSYDGLDLYQFNAVTEKLLAQARLRCNFYGNNKSNMSVMNQQIFKGVKATISK